MVHAHLVARLPEPTPRADPFFPRLGGRIYAGDKATDGVTSGTSEATSVGAQPAGSAVKVSNLLLPFALDAELRNRLAEIVGQLGNVGLDLVEVLSELGRPMTATALSVATSRAAEVVAERAGPSSWDEPGSGQQAGILFDDPLQPWGYTCSARRCADFDPRRSANKMTLRHSDIALS